MSYNAQTPIGDIALNTPASIPLFETLGLDYCCGGHLPLGSVCQAAELDVQKVLADLEKLEAQPKESSEPSTLAAGTLTELIAHIEKRHHTYTREALDRLKPLADKVFKVHGDRHPELGEIRGLFQALAADLGPHLEKEEQILFPYIRAMEGSKDGYEACFATVLGPISVMQREHEDAGEVLARLKQLSKDYMPPDDACTSFRALYQGLKDLEADLHRHIFLENHILFPRAAELEKQS